MIKYKRPVDRAMADGRMEKKTVRALWVDKVKAVARTHPNCNEPWFLTLSGAEGHDIQLLIEEGLVKLTEVNSIADKDKNKIVAVENSTVAVATLQRKFIGLRIKEVDFASLVRGEGFFSWPQGDDEVCCRAHVVNLDLDTPLKALNCDGSVVFPVVAWIKKLCLLHGRPQHTDWILCLTLHGEVIWTEDINQWTKTFLRENFQREPNFSKDCNNFFGPELYGIINGDDDIDFTRLESIDQQKFIMVIVPKLIANYVHNDGWYVHTEHCLRYGGDGSHAPMVTWIVRFAWDGTAADAPDSLYRTALNNILSGAGIVKKDGSIAQFKGRRVEKT